MTIYTNMKIAISAKTVTKMHLKRKQTTKRVKEVKYEYKKIYKTL